MNIAEKFNFLHYGQNPELPKLIFLHGLMGSAANWRRIADRFAQDFYVTAYDQRGHGESFHPDSGYRPEDYADDLLSILDYFGWEQIHLVGHSMGGRNALNFAHRFPQRIKSLVVEDIGPERHPESVSYIENIVNSVPTPFKTKREAKSFLLNDFVKLHHADPQAKILSQYLYTNIREQNNGFADWRFSKKGILESVTEGRKMDRWNEVVGLKMPTLWIRGDRSVELPQSEYEEILRKNNNIQGVVIPDSGHWVHFDQPEPFIAALQQFFGL